MERLKTFGKTQAQRLLITAEFFNGNGLANHAAACAYGFLLSAAPALLLISIFLLAAFRSSPQTALALVKTIPFLDVVFDETWLTDDLLAFSQPGISGLISAVSIFWAGRVFALSLLRGLKIIFTGEKKRGPVAENLVVLLVEFLVLLFALLTPLFSQTALQFYEVINFLPQFEPIPTLLSLTGSHLFPVFMLGLVSCCAYRFITVNAPACVSAFWGALACVIPYEISSEVLRLLMDQTKYNFLYGALGNLILLLVNVYFFFIFFFFGAQFARVIDSFDALLFIKLRRTRTTFAQNGAAKRPGFLQRMFFSVEGKLKKYFYSRRAGELIFSKGDEGNEIYYILEGEIEVYLPLGSGEEFLSVLGPGAFFGEMSHMLSEKRNASVRAKTALTALALPPELFDELIKYDTSLDRVLIEHLSQRLRIRNEQVNAFTTRADG